MTGKVTRRWVIVGGGPVGCHIAMSLLRENLVNPVELCILDPRPLLALWRSRTKSCGMRYLRSSCVHHLGASSSDLATYQKRNKWSSRAFRGRSRCPSLESFNSHCDHLINKWRLQSLRMPATVRAIVPENGCFRILTDQDDVVGHSVVLALGSSPKQKIPAWLECVSSHVRHILSPDLKDEEFEPGSRIAVLGGGMTAVQAALKLAAQHEVTLITRSPIIVSEFDSEASWMGPMKGTFLNLAPLKRARAIASVRKPGTINPETYYELRSALRAGRLQHKEVENPVALETNQAIKITDGDWQLETDFVLLGTGLKRRLHPIQEQLHQQHGAKVVSNLPDLDRSLQWLPHLYVVGKGAELQLGPAAGNIIGARLAAQRIVSSLSSSRLHFHNEA